MAGKRRYDDACAAAHALDLVGERWALLVARELMLGPRRFTDLRAGLPGVSPNVLTQRLAQLEEFGVLRRRRLPGPGGAVVYELTDWGRELEPVLLALGRWGARSPLRRRDAPLGATSLMLSFRTMFDAPAAAGLRASVELRVAGETFHADVRGGRLAVAPGPADAPDAVIEADAAMLAGVVYRGARLADVQRAGRLRLAGDRALAGRFLRLFRLPEPVAPTVREKPTVREEDPGASPDRDAARPGAPPRRTKPAAAPRRPRARPPAGRGRPA